MQATGMEGIEAAAFQHNWASSSTPSDPSPTAMTPVVARPNEFLMMDYSQLDMEECLLMFYSKFYPFDRIYRVKGPYFTRREFSMTLANQTYIRFLSFLGEADMRERIVQAKPIKIDIGAIYSARPSEKKSLMPASFSAIERELVFDIDLTDYDDIRKCCQNKKMCIKCWQYIVAAVKVLDAILRMDFGFVSILWVFSGRRGIHCWVADKRARTLDSGLRKAIVSYIEISRSAGKTSGNGANYSVSNGGSYNNSSAVESHPMIKRALSLVSPIFKQKILPELLSEDVENTDLATSLSGLCPAPNGLIEMWKKEKICDPLERWKTIVQQLCTSEKKQRSHLAEEFILHRLYPRLDSNVSIGLNHLLKAPFCVHPDTGKICVPIDPALIDKFDPDMVPTIHSILSKENGSDHLQPYLLLMDQFLESLNK
ncbi:DNA primase [Mitosporidium daphniae]|uniref:DNA primase n=1 Tax=Mitosporidium daphniae TaxID=1485682 RepID=A0A098VT96_9MICR|nr:DNA primase [Mitosporidium daphniae]KGG50906.1 DNA primase [Mitosporidium daphniae]|eukprot:XP_013237333.1 DNA primase [Mitosporidium daphniae]